MTTVVELLNLCLKDLGVVGEGQTASADSMNDAFTTLQQMLGLWQADKLYVYAQREIPATLTGQTSYTVGAGGDINTARPVKIDGAIWRLNGVDTPLTVFQSFEDYQRIGVKVAGGTPCAVCYVGTFPLGTLYVYPNDASGELRLIARTDLPTLFNITDTISLPPEYVMALRYSLDEYLATLFQTPLRPDIPALAARARKIMKRNNVSIPLSKMPSTVMRGYRNNIGRY